MILHRFFSTCCLLEKLCLLGNMSAFQRFSPTIFPAFALNSCCWISNYHLLHNSQYPDIQCRISKRKENLLIGVSAVPCSNVSTHLFTFCPSSLSLRQLFQRVYFACMRNEGEGLKETESDREREGGRCARLQEKKASHSDGNDQKKQRRRQTAHRIVRSSFDATVTGRRTAHLCV